MTRSILDPSQFHPLGDVQRVTRIERGILLDVGNERFRVEVIRDDIVRLKLSTLGAFDETPTFAASFEMPAVPPFEVADSSVRADASASGSRDEVTLSTARLKVVIQKRPFSMSAFRADGSVIFESASGPDGVSRGLMMLNDGFLVGRRAAADDHVFGLGQKTGRLDRRGRNFVLWNLDVLARKALEKNRLVETDLAEPPESTTFDPYYTTIPFFYHARCHANGCDMAGFFLDNGYKGNVELESKDALYIAFGGGQYTEYVFAGPDMRSILEGYTFVTGRIERPPLWSLGHHQCRWYDYTADELSKVGREYRARNIPCDTLWLDIGYMDGYRVFTWDSERFPDVPRFLGDLRAAGFRAVTIVDPGVKYESGYSIFDEGKRANLFCKTEGGILYEGQVWPGRTAFPDFVKAETRAWWGDHNGRLASTGIAGIWNDMNEPATGQVEPFAMRFDRDGENAPHERYHNQYGFLMAMATHQGLLAAEPTLRPFILSRAGFAGIQRVAAQWLGDNCAQWDHLEMGIAMALGMGISGQAFIGGDIPGFCADASSELAARWFQYGALTPFCRCHNQMGQKDKYPWSFGSEVESVARSALAFRYRLLPYLYTAFVKASETGEPVQRPLVFDFQHDPKACTVDDQYMLGNAVLVAPIVRPGQTARAVYLPQTREGWIEWRTGKHHAGGLTVSVPAPLDSIPMFVRSGSIIPMLEAAPATTMGFYPDALELQVFVPEHDGEWTSLLVEDDGLTFAFRKGAELRTEMTLVRRGSELRLRTRTTGKGFAERRRHRLRVHVVAPSSPVVVDLADGGDELELVLRS